MKKSLLAIVLLATGVTFANAQKKEGVKLQKAQKTEALQKAEAKAEMQSVDSMNAETTEVKTADQKKVEEMKMKTAADAKSTDDTLSTQKARKESVE